MLFSLFQKMLWFFKILAEATSVLISFSFEFYKIKKWQLFICILVLSDSFNSYIDLGAEKYAFKQKLRYVSRILGNTKGVCGFTLSLIAFEGLSITVTQRKMQWKLLKPNQSVFDQPQMKTWVYSDCSRGEWKSSWWHKACCISLCWKKTKKKLMLSSSKTFNNVGSNKKNSTGITAIWCNSKWPS